MRFRHVLTDEVLGDLALDVHRASLGNRHIGPPCSIAPHMLGDTGWKNRDEREIGGCRFVLDVIRERRDGIIIAPCVIL